MRYETISTTNMIIYLIKKYDYKHKIKNRELIRLKIALYDVLYSRFKKNWFPHDPWKRSSFRCIRINEHELDQVVILALKKAYLSQNILLYISRILSHEITIWTDPLQCEIRENGFCTIFYYFENLSITTPWDHQELEDLHLPDTIPTWKLITKFTRKICKSFCKQINQLFPLSEHQKSTKLTKNHL